MLSREDLLVLCVTGRFETVHMMHFVVRTMKASIYADGKLVCGVDVVRLLTV